MNLRKTKITAVLIMAAIGGGTFSGQSASGAYILPTTPCDGYYYNPPIKLHMDPSMVLEDGTKAFTYGSGAGDFITVTGGVLYFNFDLLFEWDEQALFKIYFFGSGCGPVYGDTSQALKVGANLFSYDPATGAKQLNYERPEIPRPNGIPRYLSLEVWDGMSNSGVGSYSYLIDLQNPQNPDGSPEPPQKRLNPDPVIIIPGILGSEQKNGEWVIDPILHTYDDLIDTLKANGYREGYDLFTFPYNWRESNVDTALYLEDKIDEVQMSCDCDKVDLVAHSMGGLVARQYIQSDRYGNDVDQLIFLGTPHLGAPKAYLAWEGGEVGPTREDRILTFILSKEGRKSGFDSLHSYIKNKPITSLQQLLANFDYIKEKDTGLLRRYPDNYPQSLFLDNLKNSTSRLNERVNVTSIIGNVLKGAINTIRVVPSNELSLWEHGYPEDFNEKIGDRGLEMGTGDGTVPLSSASFIIDDLQELDAEHLVLPTKAAGIIYQRLSGKVPDEVIDKRRLPNAKILILKMLSPADMVIIAPDGKRIGKDFATGQEFSEIPDAFYSGFATDDEFITILNPLDGQYQVETQGTDNGGEYTVATAFIGDDFSVEKDFTAQITPGATQEIQITLDNASPDDLEIKPADITPPEIGVISPENRDYLRSEVLPINVGIEDSETGVFSSKIRFDDTMVENGQTIDLFFQTLGNHNLTVSASDFVANSTTTTTDLRIIATPESTISDIERVYIMGWITKEKIRDSLIKKMQAAIRLEKRIEYLEEKLRGKPRIVKRIEKIEKKIDKVLMKAMLLELKAYRKNFLNEQAYLLLSEDINWLINNN